MAHLQTIRQKIADHKLQDEIAMMNNIIQRLMPEILASIQVNNLQVYIGGSLPMMCMSGASEETILENLGDIDLYPENYAIMMACLGPIQNEKCQIIPHKFESFIEDVLGTYDSSMVMVGFDLKRKIFICRDNFVDSLSNGVFDYILRTTSPEMHQSRFNKLLERAEIFFNTTLQEYDSEAVLIPDRYLRCSKTYQQSSYLEYFCGMINCVQCKNLSYLALCTDCSAKITTITPAVKNQMIEEGCLVIGTSTFAKRLYAKVQGRYGNHTALYDGSSIEECVRLISKHRNIFLVIDVRPSMLEINKINDQKGRITKILELVQKQSEFLHALFDEYLMFKNNELKMMHELHIVYSSVTGYDPNQKLEYQLQNSTLYNSIEIRAGLLFTNRLAMTLTIVPYLSDMTELDQSLSYDNLSGMTEEELVKIIRNKKSEGADTSYIRMINADRYATELRKIFKISKSLDQIIRNITNIDRYVLYVGNIFLKKPGSYFVQPMDF
jgi:hypothetical protein